MKRSSKRGLSLDERLMRARGAQPAAGRSERADVPEVPAVPETPDVPPARPARAAAPPPSAQVFAEFAVVRGEVEPEPERERLAAPITFASLLAPEADTFLPAGSAPPPPAPRASAPVAPVETVAAEPVAPAADVRTEFTDFAEFAPPSPPPAPAFVAPDDDLFAMTPLPSADAPVETPPTLPTRLVDRWARTSRLTRSAAVRGASLTPEPPAETKTAIVPTAAAPESVEETTSVVTEIVPPAAEVAQGPEFAEVAREAVADVPQSNSTAVEQASEAAFADTLVHEESPWQRPRVPGGKFGRVGATLIDRGLVTHEQLDHALEVQRSSGGRVGEILVGLGALSAFELARVLADHLGVPFTDLRAKPPDPILASLLPEDVARRYDALPIARWNDQLVIAMANPTDLFALDDLQMVTGQPIIAAMAVEEDLRAAIDRVYRSSTVETTLDAATTDYKTETDVAAQQTAEVNEGPIVGLVNALLEQAVTDRASDLHVEPCSTHIAVRLRIDGVLHDTSEVPLELLRPLVSRLKILSGLDIAQNRISQDGRFSLEIQGRSVDVRVVTMPTAAGESVILRLLDPVRDTLGAAGLGLNASEQARFLPAFHASQGAVFIVGPTGSGKTSTVYAMLSEINSRDKSIVSVEDPVEFRLDGVKQIQINTRVGVTFPTTLPSVLRADPDIVFIGEVRDTDTARIAADASITGHLVLSTLHATRAAAAPMRLIEMGVEPYLVASALTLVASQRLGRKLCERCAEDADAGVKDQLRDLGADTALLDTATVRRAVGCSACRNTGYRGRLPIFEILPMTEGVSRLILDRAPRAQIERLAIDEGMETLRLAALRRVARGELSIEEMLRIVT